MEVEHLLLDQILHLVVEDQEVQVLLTLYLDHQYHMLVGVEGVLDNF